MIDVRVNPNAFLSYTDCNGNSIKKLKEIIKFCILTRLMLTNMDV